MRRLLVAIFVLWSAPAAAQIAFDAGGTGADTVGTSLSWSHTTSGTNRFLFVCVYVATSPPTVTYNGVSMTWINSITFSSDTLHLYGLANPASGTNTVQVTTGSSATIYGWSQSYTGADQGAVDTTSATQADQDGNDAMAISLAVADATSWTVLAYWNPNNTSGTASTGATLRVTQAGYAGFKSFDSGGTVSGTHTMNITGTGGANMIGIIGRIKAAGGGGGGATPCRRGLLGVGCDE